MACEAGGFFFRKATGRLPTNAFETREAGAWMKKKCFEKGRAFGRKGKTAIELSKSKDAPKDPLVFGNPWDGLCGLCQTSSQDSKWGLPWM